MVNGEGNGAGFATYLLPMEGDGEAAAWLCLCCAVLYCVPTWGFAFANDSGWRMGDGYVNSGAASLGFGKAGQRCRCWIRFWDGVLVSWLVGMGSVAFI